MKEHIIPAIIASVVASGAAIGFVHIAHTPVVNVVNTTTVAKPISPAKAAHAAKTVWPEMAQTDIDKLTTALNAMQGVHRVTIYCVEDAKCGDVALNLENAFESAHWQTDVIDYPMIQPGVMTGSKDLLAALKASGFDAKLDDSVRAVTGDVIAIGNRYVP